jgi:hypothetical protein
MIWLTICVDAFGSNRKGLAGIDYSLRDFHGLPLFETDAVYGVPIRVDADAS